MVSVTNSLLLTFCLIAAATAASLPAAQQLRFGRDVSEAVAEPVSNYLPPEVDQYDASSPAPAAQLNEAVEEDSVVVEAAPTLAPNGYEYRIVRKLRYRQRRDVSHLNLGYLPPVDKPKPAKIYLPPHVDVPAPLPKLSNEYLPPVHEDIKTEPITEAPAEEPAASTEPAATEEQQDTAIFADDGYHYKKPAVEPNLGPAPEVEDESESEPEAEPESEPEAEPETAPSAEPAPLLREYLPPLDNAVGEAEGPDDENAALHDDGYHYRVVKRARFF